MHEKKETAQHHFLFHIFKMDKAEHPMPRKQALTLLQILGSVFADKNNGR